MSHTLSHIQKPVGEYLCRIEKKPGTKVLHIRYFGGLKADESTACRFANRVLPRILECARSTGL